MADPRFSHRNLRALLEELASADADRAASLLQRLRDHLPEHFEAEEAEGGWFGQALEAAPHHADEIARLRVQHRALLKGARDASTPADVQAVVQALLDHERAEGVILTEIWYEDLGEGD